MTYWIIWSPLIMSISWFSAAKINAFIPLIDVWEVMVNTMPPAIKATILGHPVVSLLVISIDIIVGLSASMSIQEKIPGKNIDENLVILAGVAPPEQVLHLRLEMG